MQSPQIFNSIMDEEDLVNNLRAEIDLMLSTFKKIEEYNTLGKTKQIADLVRPILTTYKR